MKGFLKWFCVSYLMGLLAPAFLSAELNRSGFDDLLQEIHRHNAIDPVRSVSLAEKASAYVAENDSLANRIRLAAALAPLDALESGYRDARHRLISYIGEVEASGMPAHLHPLLRYALSDLAYRNGEYRYSFRQLIGSLQFIGPENPEFLKQAIWKQVVLINKSAGLNQFTLMMLDQLGETGDVNRVETLLLEAEVRWQMRQFDEVQRTLDTVSSLFNSETSPYILARFWLQRVWLCLAQESHKQAEEFLLMAAIQNGGDVPAVLEGDIHFLEAFLLIRGRQDDAGVGIQILGDSREAYRQAGMPGRFAEMLHRAFFLYESVYNLQVDVPFLEAISRYAHSDRDLRAHGKGLTAWAELSLRQGAPNLDLAAERYAKGLRYSTHFIDKMGDLQVEWLMGSPVLGKTSGHAAESVLFYYTLILLLVLVVILLVLVLRIRGQRHLNRQLAETVQKARIAEEAAEESNRLKTRFLANISHEIKTPMSGLVGMASILDELVTDPTQRKYLSTIRACSENLLVLVNDLLDLGRMDSGNFEIENAPFRVSELMNYCLDLVRGSASKKGIELQLDMAEGLPDKLVGDSTRIGQIITNLLTNAIKFTDKGRVLVTVEYAGTLGTAGHLRMVVEDTGIGIAPEKLHTIFQPFSQERPHTEGRNDGSGLGLAICHKLVELMGGSIQLRSTPGKGSRFEVTIPVKH